MSTIAQALTRYRTAARALERAADEVTRAVRAEARRHAVDVRPELTLIIETIAEVWGGPTSAILGRSRDGAHVRVRLMAMCVAREVTRCSAPQIGRGFWRDHSTVLSACKTVADWCETDLKAMREYEVLRAACQAALKAMAKTHD